MYIALCVHDTKLNFLPLSYFLIFNLTNWYSSLNHLKPFLEENKIGGKDNGNKGN